MSTTSMKARLRKMEGKRGGGVLHVYLAWGRTHEEALGSVKVPVPAGHLCAASWPFDDEPVPAGKWLTDATVDRLSDREIRALVLHLDEAASHDPGMLDAPDVASLRMLTDGGLMATVLSAPAFTPRPLR